MKYNAHKSKIRLSFLTLTTLLVLFGACNKKKLQKSESNLDDLSQSLGEASEIATFIDAKSNNLSVASFMIRRQDDATTSIMALDERSDTVAEFIFKKNADNALNLRILKAGNSSESLISVGQDGKYQILQADSELGKEGSESRKLFDLMEKSFDAQ